MTSAERQKAYRERKRVTPDVTPVTRNARRNARCPQCVALAKEVEMLRLDQARLKGELSAARKASGQLRVPSVEESAEWAVGRTVTIPGGPFEFSESAKSQNANKHTMTPHGRNCQSVCCKYGRPA